VNLEPVGGESRRGENSGADPVKYLHGGRAVDLSAFSELRVAHVQKAEPSTWLSWLISGAILETKDLHTVIRAEE
jgi:hypothetical protein